MVSKLRQAAGEFADGGTYSPESRLRDYTAQRTRKMAPMDLPFLLLVILLLAIGVIMVLSASYASAAYNLAETGGNPTYYFFRQMVFAVTGVALMMVTSRIRVSLFRKAAFPLMGVSVVLLIMVAIPGVGTTANGATRWLNLGFTTIQPSEVAKLAQILLFAHLICNYRDKMGTFKYGVLPFASIMGVLVALLFLEPHISASVIIVVVGLAMMFLGGTRLGWFVGGGVVIGAGGVVVLNQFAHASERILAWRDPFEYAQGKTSRANGI